MVKFTYVLLVGVQWYYMSGRAVWWYYSLINKNILVSSSTPRIYTVEVIQNKGSVSTKMFIILLM